MTIDYNGDPVPMPDVSTNDAPWSDAVIEAQDRDADELLAARREAEGLDHMEDA